MTAPEGHALAFGCFFILFYSAYFALIACACRKPPQSPNGWGGFFVFYCFAAFCQGGLGALLELAVIELCVEAVLLQQRLVGSLLDNVAVFQHENHIRILNG